MRTQPAINSGPAPVKPATNEQQLVRAVLAKERKSTAEFVELCTDWIYGLVRRRLMPRAELVEDFMQEILLAAWQALPSFRQESSLRGWVLGIAHHKLDDYYRRRILETDLPEEDDEPEQLTLTPAFEEQLDSAAQQERIEEILAELPEAYSLALLWRYRDEKNAREMAQLTGKTEKAIERLLARARQSFRRRWNDAQP